MVGYGLILLYLAGTASPAALGRILQLTTVPLLAIGCLRLAEWLGRLPEGPCFAHWLVSGECVGLFVASVVLFLVGGSAAASASSAPVAANTASKKGR